MEVKCEVLTPVFIGSGEEYSQLDYFMENGYVNIVDLEKALSDLDDLKKIDYISKLIVSNIDNNRLDLDAKEILKSVGLDPYDYIIKKIRSEIPSNSRTRIKKFINQNNNYYIPGSSIKGAIRTAYLFNYYNKNFKQLLDILEDENIKLDYKGIVLENFAISGKKDIKKDIIGDFFKYLKVSDSLELNGDFIFIATKRWSYRKKRFSIPINVEGLKKGTFTIDLKVDEEFFKNINKKLKTNYSPKNTEEIFEALKELCNSFSKAVVKFELERDNPVYVEKSYEKLLRDISKNDAIYLNLGFGGGFLTKTIYPLLWDYDKNLIYFKKLKKLFINMNKRNKKLKDAWLSAYNYTDFPTTKVVYTIRERKNTKAISPLGWIKMERVE